MYVMYTLEYLRLQPKKLEYALSKWSYCVFNSTLIWASHFVLHSYYETKLLSEDGDRQQILFPTIIDSWQLEVKQLMQLLALKFRAYKNLIA